MISKKGFTLIEMLAVIVIIAIIMALVLPAATRVRNNNKTRIYKEYESMMVEYAKVNELNYQDSIDLIDLDELEKVKNECSGYVEIDHSTTPPKYTSFITCGDEYTTDNYDRTYAKTIIAVPECKSGLIYNGTNQDLVATNEGYAISNGVRKDAGKQDVTLTINDTSTYIWADATSTPKVIKNCEIAKRQITVKANNLTMNYGNNLPEYSYVMSNSISGEDPFDGTVSFSTFDENNNPVTINETTPIGVYVIKPNVNVTSNFTVKLEDGVLILLRGILSVPTCESKVYTGVTQTLFEAHTTGSYTNSAITGIDVGNYTGTLTQNNNYQWNNDDPNNPVTITCTITPKSVPVTWGSTTTFAYNGSAQAPTASATGVSGETINVTRTTQTNASTTNYTSTASCSSVTGGRAKCSNYTLTGTTKSFTINKAACTLGVTATQSWSTTFSTSAQTKAISLATGGKGTVTYTINSQKNSSGTTVNNFSISNTTLSMNASTGAGTYTVVIRVTDTGNTNYSGCNKDITITVTINKASNPITVTTPQSINVFSREIVQTREITAATNNQGTVTYAIQSQKNSSGTSVSQFTISGTTITTKANTAVGTYTVVVRATAAGNSNYNSGYKDITVNVTVKKPILADLIKEEINDSSCSCSWVDNMDTTSTSDDVTYLKGKNDCVNFNYLWYSGRLWRVVALYSDGTIKLTTENNMTIIYWGSSTEYKNSWIYQWLNEDFYDTLYNVSNVVVSHTWNYSTIDRTNVVRPTSVSPQKTVSAKVGLLNSYEYKKTGYYLSNLANSWLLSPTSSTNVSYADNGNNAYIFDSTPNVSQSGVRPAIVIKSGLEATGEGTINNPFKLKIDKASPTVNSTLLNTRSVGEYVKFNNEIYRIVEIQNSTTKLVKVDVLKDSSNNDIKKKISSTFYGSSAATQSTNYWDYYLNNTWYNSLSSTSKNMMVNGTYYLGVYGSAGVHYKNTICKNSNLDSVTVKNCTKYTSSDANMTYTGKVGLSRVGEMFSALMDTTSTTYSTLYLITPYTSSGTIYRYIDNHTKLGSTSSENPARPTINIKSTVKITGGTGYVGGSTSSPYTIG